MPGKAEANGPVSFWGGSSNFWAAQESLAILGVVLHVWTGMGGRGCSVPTKAFIHSCCGRDPLHSRLSEAARSFLQILVERLGLFSPPWTPASPLDLGACPQDPQPPERAACSTSCQEAGRHGLGGGVLVQSELF